MQEPSISTRPGAFRRLPAVVLAGLLWAWLGAAHAVGLRPGLWSFAVQTSTNGGPMIDMAQMLHSVPPAVLAQLQGTLKARGLQLGGAGMEMCLGPKVAQATHPPLHLQGQCTEHWTEPTAGTFDFRYSCTAPPSHGQGSVSIASPTAYATHYAATEPTGSVASNSQAHWVHADCGGVPPVVGTQ